METPVLDKRIKELKSIVTGQNKIKKALRRDVSFEKSVLNRLTSWKKVLKRKKAIRTTKARRSTTGPHDWILGLSIEECTTVESRGKSFLNAVKNMVMTGTGGDIKKIVPVGDLFNNPDFEVGVIGKGKSWLGGSGSIRPKKFIDRKLLITDDMTGGKRHAIAHAHDQLETKKYIVDEWNVGPPSRSTKVGEKPKQIKGYDIPDAYDYYTRYCKIEVDGKMIAPTTRLSREEFNKQFDEFSSGVK